MPKFTITTLGCKVNQYESEALAQKLSDDGQWVISRDKEIADLCIINTCTVTQKASMQSRQAIRQAIRSHPKARIIVTGCYAQTEPDEINKIKGVHHVIGHFDKHKLPDMILAGKENILPSPDLEQKIHHFNPMPSVGLGYRTRPFLKIQDGCNDFCTYCIVPYARGPSRSLPPERVLDNINKIHQAGYHEVVLTGIHLGNYGIDLGKRKADLLELLNRIRKTCTIDRVRLSSIEPFELTEDIIKFVAQSGSGPAKICHHFHIPLQSGDDFILKKMHRPYSRSFFIDLVEKIHKLLPDCAIGVDTLIGFPGESDRAFENTYSLIEQLPVSYLHVFPFSPRKGTPAYSYPDKVNSNVIRERCQKMRTLGKLKRNVFYNKFKGKTLEILIEGKQKKSTNLLKGITSNYIPVLVKGDDKLKNTMVNVTIDEVNDSNQVFGTTCG
ncbi:MAG: tRNA (N(6)-L-threonylcarbamoyladenosine(37)-C(2))-methylthiotransferase MtaB [Desulfobacterales bacterium]|nr:tRNA (N(6)-L-threonylcarbamoyladenosine(37)-C(2))-methylthiotransferase MtaB [Desulfobacterales bacterium]MDX2508729.1 tRNA (N(6)-L-threonylcarbamoyladenosine(37)-C(2))-methylthiotransferase MtaB [Desulfobacterales bacterium]